jgi:molybdenum cofactor biosynthesis protein B
VLTVSDTRTAETDSSGRAIREFLERAGHQVTGFAIVRDEPTLVTASVKQWLTDAATRVIITTGGTGITTRDGTFEAMDALFEKRLDGFGELFRMLSFEEIGAAAMMSRAVAGTVGGCVVVSMPGSTAAVELAMRRLLLPELGHMVSLVRDGPAAGKDGRHR